MKLKRPMPGTLGSVVLAFGAGMLMTCFLPCGVLVAIEALVIVAAGALCLGGRR